MTTEEDTETRGFTYYIRKTLKWTAIIVAIVVGIIMYFNNDSVYAAINTWAVMFVVIFIAHDFIKSWVRETIRDELRRDRERIATIEKQTSYTARMIEKMINSKDRY